MHCKIILICLTNIKDIFNKYENILINLFVLIYILWAELDFI